MKEELEQYSKEIIDIEDNRGKHIVLIAMKLKCFVETASRLYARAERENKVEWLLKRCRVRK